MCDIDLNDFIYINLKNQLRDRLLIELNREFPDINVSTFVDKVIDNDIDFSGIDIAPEPDENDTPETLSAFIFEFVENIDFEFLKNCKSKIILNNEIDLKEYGKEHFNSIYDKCFKNILSHPNIVLSNKHKHKCDWRNKVLKDEQINHSGKPDYILILLKRVIELEAEISVIKGE